MAEFATSFNADIDSYLSNLVTSGTFGSFDPLLIQFTSGKDSEVLRSILRFDTSSLPNDAVIASGVLTLEITSADAAKAHFARRVTQTAWVESQVSWDEYSTGNS